MDKTDKQRLEILKRISAGNRSMSGSRSTNAPKSNNVNTNNQNKEASNTQQPKPGCNVCSRNKRT